MSEKPSFADLAKVNVNEHVEKKANLSYLSWAWAVDYMTRLDPDATWEYREWDGKPFLTLPDCTCMVYCTVTFGGRTRTCHLPVMDYKNKAIANPDAFQVNTAMQRCLVKAIALHGLGLYIYAGEDLPKEEADAKGNPPDVAKQLASADVKPNSDAGKSLTAEQRSRVETLADEVIDAYKAGFLEAGYDAIEAHSLETDEKLYLWSRLDSVIRSSLKKIGDARKKAKLKELESTQP